MHFKLAAVICATVLSGAGAAFGYDVPGVAREIVRRDMPQAEWQVYARKVADHFETWKRDNPSGSFNRYLDDKLLERAPGVLSGKVDNLKSFVYWLALYKEFDQYPPWYIRQMAEKHGAKFQAVLEDFSWEKFSAMILQKKQEVEEENAKAAALVQSADGQAMYAREIRAEAPPVRVSMEADEPVHTPPALAEGDVPSR